MSNHSFPGARTSLQASTSLPQVVEAGPELAEVSPQQFAAWLKQNKPSIEAALLEHGAVLLRGFPVPDTSAFEKVVAIFEPLAMGYAGGAALRSRIQGQVMESTRADKDRYLKLHQEMAYLPNNPRVVAFYCRVAPATQGATPIADMRKVTAGISRPLLEKMRRTGVMYVRNLRKPDPNDDRANPSFVHNDWVANFGTSDRSEVEAACTERGLEFRWLEDGSLELRNTRPALIRHPSTEDELYFSQAHLQISCRQSMGEAAFGKMAKVYGSRPRPFDSRLGDGSRFTEAELDEIHGAYENATVRFDWRAGDVMFVENKLTAHGREPYTGQREVQVALLD